MANIITFTKIHSRKINYLLFTVFIIPFIIGIIRILWQKTTKFSSIRSSPTIAYNSYMITINIRRNLAIIWNNWVDCFDFNRNFLGIVRIIINTQIDIFAKGKYR